MILSCLRYIGERFHSSASVVGGGICACRGMSIPGFKPSLIARALAMNSSRPTLQPPGPSRSLTVWRNHPTSSLLNAERASGRIGHRSIRSSRAFLASASLLLAVEILTRFSKSIFCWCFSFFQAA